MTLAVEGVSKAFGGLRAVADVTAVARAGAVTGLIGPNGAGKSTLFNIVAGTVAPDRGTVTYEGRRLDRLPAHRRPRWGIARTFQLSRVIRGMTVAELLVAAARPRLPVHPWTGVVHGRRLRHQEAAARRRAYGLLDRFGIADVADHRTGDISGGQRKLVDIARALMARPSMVLLDEPAAGVNPVLAGRIGELIAELRDEGLAFFVIDHNMAFLEQIADYVLVMAEGRLLTEGTLAEVANHPEVLDAYLGHT